MSVICHEKYIFEVSRAEETPTYGPCNGKQSKSRVFFWMLIWSTVFGATPSENNKEQLDPGNVVKYVKALGKNNLCDARCS